MWDQNSLIYNTRSAKQFSTALYLITDLENNWNSILKALI